MAKGPKANAKTIRDADGKWRVEMDCAVTVPGPGMGEVTILAKLDTGREYRLRFRCRWYGVLPSRQIIQRRRLNAIKESSRQPRMATAETNVWKTVPHSHEGTTMIRVSFLLAMGTFLACVPARSWANAPKEDELIRAIVESWKGRQARISTLTASAMVDSFFSKGYVTAGSSSEKRDRPIRPEKDRLITGEPVSWAIDFEKIKLRVEKDLSGPAYHGPEDYELVQTYNLALAANGTSSIWCNPNRYPQRISRRA